VFVASLARTVKRLRTARGLTQAELAAKARVSQGYLSQIESGLKQDFTLRVALRVAKALGVRVEDLAR
jgi:transcriptional regulator with XRE-family HTH domain